MKHTVKPHIVLSLVVLIAVSCGPVTPVAITAATKLPVSTSLPSAALAKSLLHLSPSNGPDRDISSYKFRTWTEDNYTEIIDSLNDLVTGQGDPILSWNLPDYQLAFELERLLQFPDSTERDKILWSILVNKPGTVSIPGKSDRGDLMSSLISEMLAQNIRPADVSNELINHGLRVDSTITVHNMIGNGQDGLVLLIGVRGADSLMGVFVIYRSGGKFQVQKIRDWEVFEGVGFGRYFELHNVGDTNGNSIPEIVVQVEAAASGMPQTWKETIDQIEWSSEKEIFQSQSFPVFWQDCDQGPCEGDWKFSTIDAQSALTTRSYWSTRKDCPDLIIQRTFVWNGTEYSLGSTEVVPPASDFAPECRLAWAETAIWMPASMWDNGITKPGWKNDLAISIIEESLRRWPAHADEIWGPASRDYFRLQLGMWYELRDESSKAKSILQQVAHKSYRSEYDFTSRLASLYLKERAVLGRAKACAVLENAYIEELRSTFPEPPNDERMLAAWGIVDGKGSLCNEYDLLPLDIKGTRLTSSVSLLQWLDRHEFTVYQKTALDLNSDGLEDYVLLLDTQDIDSADAWAFLATPEGYQARAISTEWSGSEQTELGISSIKVGDGASAHLILLDGILVAFRVNTDLSIETWEEVYGVKSYDIVDEVQPAKIVMNIDSDYEGKRTTVYVWDAQTQSFIEQTDPYVNARIEIEDLLFTKQDYEAVIRYIDEFLQTAPPEPKVVYACGADIPGHCKYFPERYVPYFRYLRGLAYEQLGQNEQAKRAYFELWQDFPKNVFGMAASLKLEPISP